MLFVSQANWNTIGVFTLLLIILAILIKPRKLLRSLYRKPNFQYYLNTQAKIKSLYYSPNGIITIDSEGIIIAWNGGATTMFGYKEEEMLGKPLSIIIPERYRERHLSGLARVKNTGHSKLLGSSMELEGLRKGKMEFPIRLTIWKWFEGVDVFYTGIVEDITEERAKDAKVQSIIDVYRRSEELTDSGTWSWDVLNDKVYTTEGFNRIFDIEGGDIDSTYLLKRVYREDLPHVEKAIKKAFEDKKGYSLEYRLVTRNGTLVPVKIIAETYLDKNGNLINITGTIHKLEEK